MKKLERTKEEVREDGLLHRVAQTNNERFNQLLNGCRYARLVYIALMSLVEPSIEQSDDVLQKRQVLIGNLLSGLDIAEGYEKII